MLIQSRYPNREEWIARYDAPKTRGSARLALVAFDRFRDAKYGQYNEDGLYESLRADEDWKYRFLDQMVQFWKLDKSPATVNNYFVFVKSWFYSQGLKTESQQIKQSVKRPKKINELRLGLTHEMIANIVNKSVVAYKCLYLMLASSGMRIGELLSLKMNDINLETGLVRLQASYTKTREGRITFISRQALDLLKPLIENKKTEEKLFELDLGKVESQFWHLRKRCNLNDKYDNGMHKVNIHSFRAFFRTKAGSVDRDFAEKILGHRGYLGQYVRLDEAQLEAIYRKVEPLVTIDEIRS